MRKIAISLTKGGVGKTTMAVYLAAGLALNDARVFLVDTDIRDQAGFMLGIRPEAGPAELLSGNNKPQDFWSRQGTGCGFWQAEVLRRVRGDDLTNQIPVMVLSNNRRR